MYVYVHTCIATYVYVAVISAEIQLKAVALKFTTCSILEI